MKFRLNLLFLLIIISSCSDSKKRSQLKEVKVSDFEIVNDYLKENDRLSIISTPGHVTTKEEDFSHYICLIGVRESVGDTVNILVFPSYAFVKSPNEKVTFIPYLSNNYKIYMSIENQISSDKDIPNPSIVKIRADVDLSFYQRFPTMIGMLGQEFIPGKN